MVATKGQRLGEVVGNIEQSRNVPDEELQLGDAILEPVQPHVTGLGKLRLHRPVGDADCDFVVAVDDRRGLGVAKVGKRLALHSGDLGGTKRAGQFGLLDQRADDWDSSGGDGEWAVDEGGIVGAAEVVEVAPHAARVGARQVGGIGHEHEPHA